MYVRYLTRGLIDGSLSTLGIVLGAAIGGDPRIVIAAGLGGALANGLSNVLGALSAEKAAVMEVLSDYDKAMVGSKTKLKDTRIYQQEQKKIIGGGITDGVATFFGAIVPIIPFIFMGGESLTQAIYFSIILTMVLLFVLGIYLGKKAKENFLISGIKMVIFAGVVALAASSLEMII